MSAARTAVATAVALAAMVALAALPALEATRACGVARAEEPDDAARALAAPVFDDAVALMDAAHCDAEPVLPADRPQCRVALDKLRRALAIYPSGLGALRNAAFCERGLGLVASALRDFREVARRAPLDPNPSKQLWAKHAQEEAQRLAARVPHLRVRLSIEPAPAGLAVAIDDAPVLSAAFDLPLPLDPGEHRVTARAPGFQPFSQGVTLEEKEDATVAIALVADAPMPALPPPPPRVHVPLVPALVVATGAATVVGGVVLGALARRSRDDACDEGSSPLHCHDAAGLEHARRLADASTVVTIAGGAVMLGGLVWYALDVRAQARSTSPSVGWRATPLAGPGLAGLAVIGAF